MRMVPSRERDAPTVLNRALDLGVTFLDTADLYSDGRNEELVGRAVRSRREEVVLGTMTRATTRVAYVSVSPQHPPPFPLGSAHDQT
jgi:aryl-alcohol dehydrogenase-like predicted oxidoreductase